MHVNEKPSVLENFYCLFFSWYNATSAKIPVGSTFQLASMIFYLIPTPIYNDMGSNILSHLILDLADQLKS